ncbi:MAG TPA: hypothetical protein VF145_14110 [Chitinophagaceae bacterium]
MPIHFISWRFEMKPVIANDIDDAAALEKQGKLEEAAALYEDAIRSGTTNETPFQRLMIIYRKLKQPKEELRIIKKGIAVFEKIFNRSTRSKKLKALSNSLMKSAGLANSKGKPLYHPEPINRWLHRKALVEKKLAR